MTLSAVINMDTEANDNVTTTDLEGQNGTNIIILTLKERCYLLQQRLKSVEQENIQLALQCSKSTSNHISQDVNVLNENIAQLTKEKSQLAHHVFMVACENKKLWSRLVNFSKSNSQYENSESANKKSALKNELSPTKDSNFTIPHLIRSQTFTTAPNPKLKARIEESGDNIEASLEEISLKVINSFLAEKSELVQQYEQMVELQMTNDKDFNYKSLGFTYLDDLNCDSLADIKQNTEKLVDLKKQAFQQQIELRSIISRLESINHKPEDGPATFNHNKPTEAFKLGSKSECQDTSETENLDSSTRWVTPANSTSYQDNMEDASAFSNNTSKISHNNVQATINNNNKNADDSNSLLSAKLKEIKINQERTCPLCGERFNASVAFETFSQHVEEHFVGDEDYDSVVENFEILNASIGNNFN